MFSNVIIVTTEPCVQHDIQFAPKIELCHAALILLTKSQGQLDSRHMQGFESLRIAIEKLQAFPECH